MPQKYFHFKITLRKVKSVKLDFFSFFFPFRWIFFSRGFSQEVLRKPRGPNDNLLLRTLRCLWLSGLPWRSLKVSMEIEGLYGYILWCLDHVVPDQKSARCKACIFTPIIFLQPLKKKWNYFLMVTSESNVHRE